MIVNKTLLAAMLAPLFLSGCFAAALGGGVAGTMMGTKVAEPELKKAAAMTLGTDESRLKISNIETQGIKTSFTVTKSGGGKWNCYVTKGGGYLGSIMTGGSNVSDALCSGTNAKGKASKTCDALSKAAGRC